MTRKYWIQDYNVSFSFYSICVHACSVMFNSLRHYGLYSNRLLCPWDSPVKSTWVSCHFLLQGTFPTQKSNSYLLHLLHWQAGFFTTAAAAACKSLQSCLTLCDPIDGSPPGSAVPGILQARTLEWGAISFSNAPPMNFLFYISSIEESKTKLTSMVMKNSEIMVKNFSTLICNCYEGIQRISRIIIS